MHHYCIMFPERKGFCAVVFRKQGSRTEFLLLHRILHWKGWEFPKGGSKKGESQLQTLRRELREESGIAELLLVKKIPTMQLFDDFIRRKKHFNQAFIAQVPASAKISISKNKCREHSSFRWVSKTQALKLLTFKDQKRVFTKARERISQIAS